MNIYYNELLRVEQARDRLCRVTKSATYNEPAVVHACGVFRQNALTRREKSSPEKSYLTSVSVT